MLTNVSWVLKGLDVTYERGQVVPMLQFAPIISPIVLQIALIDDGNYVTTCPYK